jgi:hypothetical protein
MKEIAKVKAKKQWQKAKKTWHKQRRSHDKGYLVEEPCAVKVASTVLKTSGSREVIA